jgi:branched-chain amino acid transport system permease protein
MRFTIVAETYEKDMTIIRSKGQAVLLGGLLAGLLALPFFAGAHIVNFVTLTAITLIAVHGVNIVLGYCGDITVAQAAFVGIGAYSYSIFAEFGVPWVLAMIGAVLLTGLCGVIFGLPALRVKGFYLLMVTLGAQFIIPWIFAHWKSVTGGLVYGKSVPVASMFGFSLDSDSSKYFVIVGVTVLMTALNSSICRSKLGRAFIAIRDNDLAAEAMGINVFGYKLVAFFLSAIFAGVAGCMWALSVSHLFPDHFYLMDSVWYVAMLIVGGMGTITGAILGTIFLSILSELCVVYGPQFGMLLPFKFGAAAGASLGSLVFAIVIALFLIFQPRGLKHKWDEVRKYFELYPFKQ